MKGTIRATLVSIAVAALATACAQPGYTLTGPGRVTMADTYTIDTPVAWSRSARGRVEIWTVDGPQLQSVVFVNGAKDGDPLFEGEGADARTAPRFHAAMTPIEIKELIEASLRAAGARSLEAYDVRPQAWGSIQGFRFDYSYALENGLEKEGTAVAAVNDGQLYAILYSGARFHYYGKHKDDVERMIASIRMP
ncbi:MAG: hypothetical protein ACFCUO_11965 [Rhodospirillales bacterium]